MFQDTNKASGLFQDVALSTPQGIAPPATMLLAKDTSLNKTTARLQAGSFLFLHLKRSLLSLRKGGEAKLRWGSPQYPEVSNIQGVRCILSSSPITLISVRDENTKAQGAENQCGDASWWHVTVHSFFSTFLLMKL